MFFKGRIYRFWGKGVGIGVILFIIVFWYFFGKVTFFVFVILGFVVFYIKFFREGKFLLGDVSCYFVILCFLL